MEVKKLYTPLQVPLGSFVGGSIATTYFLMSNFEALSQEAAAEKFDSIVNHRRENRAVEKVG